MHKFLYAKASTEIRMIFRGLQRKSASRKKESLSILEVFDGTIRRQRQALLLFLVLLTTATKARSQAAQDSPQDQTVNQDCSDPMMAGTAGCAQSSQLPILPNQQRYPNIATQPNTQPDITFKDNEDITARFLNRTQQVKPLSPEPLTEFQRFVAATTRQVLPIFGADLFRNVPSTFAPLDLSPVPPDYVIGPGDEIRVRVWGQINFRADLRVDRSGEIYIPQVGQIHAAGLKYSELDQHLRAAIGRIYRNFDLAADLGHIRAVQVYVTGQARRPGVYTVSSLSTLVDALFESGGASVQGSLRHIQLRRDGSLVTDFDLYALLLRGDKSKDARLLPGDVIFIPTVGSQVAITGSVRNPAIYELLSGETIGDALKDAGGASTVASDARVSLDRIEAHQSRKTMETAFDSAGLSIPLVDGDILRILSIVPMYRKTVTLRGNTANPGRFEWHAGMRLNDLIPDRDSLITREYWWKRTQLGLPGPEFEPLEKFPTLYQPSVSYGYELRRPQQVTQPPAGNRAYPGQPNPNMAAGSNEIANGLDADRQNRQTYEQQSGQAYGTLPQNPNGTRDSYPQGVPADRQASNSALASQANTQTGLAATPRNDVTLSAPEIDWGYAVIERMDPDTLKSSLISFDLEKLVLKHDASQNLELQPGDVVTIFSQADIRVPLMQQTKYVRLEGEFVHAGIYSVQPGETLRDLVRRAGGFTSYAYLYGSEFTRESTRIAQQRRIEEYVRNLELQIQRGTMALAASAVSPQDIASSTAAQSSQRELIARLQQIRATGRIVLEFQPGATGLDTLPDLALEDGDRFAVPPAPSTVNVVGAVYDQNSFLYKDQRRVGNYLHLAGGPDRSADAKHAFIIRADGSVVSRSDENGLWGNTFDALQMNPGDTLVVPEKLIKPSALRGFLDWSQLFSQLALGAAAISVIQ
jgi:protein involved in polysaccharide export with SLBB domain